MTTLKIWRRAMKTTTVVLAFLAAWAFAVLTGWAQTSQDKEQAELAKALKDAKIPLQRCHPVADVTLVRGEESKTVSEKLD